MGRWDGDALLIDTIAMTTESILNDQGLPHSESMTVSERLALVKRDGKEFLRDDITISDPDMYGAPIKVTRLFRRSSDTQMSEGSALCLLDQWRKRLEDRNKALALGKAGPQAGEGEQQ